MESTCTDSDCWIRNLALCADTVRRRPAESHGGRIDSFALEFGFAASRLSHAIGQELDTQRLKAKLNVIQCVGLTKIMLRGLAFLFSSPGCSPEGVFKLQSPFLPLLGGSWVVTSGVTSRLNIITTHIGGLETPLITTHEPPSRYAHRRAAAECGGKGPTKGRAQRVCKQADIQGATIVRMGFRWRL